MRVLLPFRARLLIYLLTGIGTPVVTYAAAKGWIGPNELSLWGAEVTFAATVAGLNLTGNNDDEDLAAEDLEDNAHATVGFNTGDLT